MSTRISSANQAGLVEQFSGASPDDQTVTTAKPNQEPQQTQTATESYVVKPGDTLSKLAARNGISLRSILQNNPQIKNPDKIFVGQQLLLQGTRSTSEYTIKRGDNLTKIAREHKTTVGDIMRANPGQISNPNLIFPGQKLRIPNAAKTPNTNGTNNPQTPNGTNGTNGTTQTPQTPETGATQTSPHLRLKSSGIKMSPLVNAKMSQIADEYHRLTGKNLTITDANRTPRDQADRMYNKIANGQADGLYKNKAALAEIKQAYAEGKARGESPAQIKDRMGAVIQKQVDRNVFVSRHLRGQGADVRINDMSRSDRAAFQQAVAKAGGATILNEGDHWHIEVDPKAVVPGNNGNTTNGTNGTGQVQTPQTNGAPAGKINLDDFLNPAKGSDSPAAIVIGNAEGNRTPNGGFTEHYRGHKDPGDKLWNIGSFSRANARFPKERPANSPAEADRMHLQKLQSSKAEYVEAMKKAGLDPNDALLASTYMDAVNQSPLAAKRMLNPDNLAYIKEKGVSVETMKDWRLGGFVNLKTGQRFTNPNGKLAGNGLADIVHERMQKKHGRPATETEIQQFIRQDQGRRVDAMAAALKKMNLLPTGNQTQTAPQTNTANGTQATQGTQQTQGVKPLNGASNTSIDVLLPASGRGYTTYNRTGNDQYGRAKTINAIRDIADAWADKNNTKVQIGDISHKGGGRFAPHSTHREGTDIDIRPFRRDGKMLPTNISNASYSRSETRELIKLIKSKYPNATILFNDPVLIREGLTKYSKGHHNHLHVVIR